MSTLDIDDMISSIQAEFDADSVSGDVAAFHLGNGDFVYYDGADLLYGVFDKPRVVMNLGMQMCDGKSAEDIYRENPGGGLWDFEEAPDVWDLSQPDWPEALKKDLVADGGQYVTEGWLVNPTREELVADFASRFGQREAEAWGFLDDRAADRGER